MAVAKITKVERRNKSLSKAFEGDSIKTLSPQINYTIGSRTGHGLHTTDITEEAYALLKKLESFDIPVVLAFFNFSTPKEGFGAFLFLSGATF